MSYTGRIHSLNNYSSREYAEMARVHQEIQRRKDAGEPVYVRWINDCRRAGSVAKLTSYDVEDVSHWYAPRNYSLIPSSRAVVTGTHYQLTNIEASWDGRRNKVNPSTYDLEFLEDWDQGTIWAWTVEPPQPRPPIPTVYGHLGEEINVEDFVSFVSKKYGYVNLHFGNVSRINHNGTVWVNTLKLRDGDVPSEVKVHDPATIVKIDKTLIDRLMMARLAVR